MNYKKLLRDRVAVLKQDKAAKFTAEKFAEKLGIEPSYLSRCLNHAEQHPSRDLLFRIVKGLGLPAIDAECVLTHYDRTLATDVEYQAHLDLKIELLRVHRALQGMEQFRSRVLQTKQRLDQMEKVLGVLDEEVDPMSSHSE